MMKNLSLFALLLSIIALPGCCWKRRCDDGTCGKKVVRTDKTARVDIPLAAEPTEVALADDEVRSFFDVDSNEMTTETAAMMNDEGDMFADADRDEEVCKHVRFDYDKANIRDDQKVVLNENIERLMKIVEESPMEPKIVVEGHTDETGSEPYNMVLSEKRAKTVADRLKAAGLKNLSVVGYGNNRPLVKTGGKEERNRRVEIHVLYS